MADCLSIDLVYLGTNFEGNPCSYKGGTPRTYYYGGVINLDYQVFSGPDCSQEKDGAETGMYFYGEGNNRVYFIVDRVNGIQGIITYVGTCYRCAIGYIKEGSFYSYYDCCGKLITGTVERGQLEINLDITKPYTSNTIVVVQPPSEIIPICPTSMPTPTPTRTLTPTPSKTATPSFTPTKTQTPTPTQTPSNAKTIPIVVNTCDSNTNFPMEVECYVINNPTTSTSTDGAVGINIIGGQNPYNVTWAYDGSKGTTLYNIPQGSYTVQVVDAYGDNDQTITCTLGSNLTCNLNGECTQVLGCDLKLTVTGRNPTGGQNNGALYVSISGSYGTPIIEWQPGGQTTSFIENLSDGDYSVTVRDPNVSGCIVSASYELGSQK